MKDRNITVGELINRLEKNAINTWRKLPNNDREYYRVRIWTREIDDYLLRLPKDLLVTPSVYVDILDKFFDEKGPDGNPDDSSKDLWKIGYYSDLWKQDYEIACVIALFDSNPFIDDSMNQIIEEINRHIRFYKEKRRP